jgi:hypothetical protein
LDKSVITRVVTVAAGRFAPGHLGELTQQVPFEMIDAVLEQTCRVQRRVRDLPARVVVYLLLAGCLSGLLRGPSPADARWRGLLVCAIDGTIMSSLTARRTWPSTQNSAAAPMAAPATRSFGCWPWSAAAPEP